jgi:hypothetical protein
MTFFPGQREQRQAFAGGEAIFPSIVIPPLRE